MTRTRHTILRYKRQEGYTFLWLLLLVAFLGLSLTMAAEIQTTSTQRDKEKELLFLGHQFRAAIGAYYQSQIAGRPPEYPATLEDLLKDSRVPTTRRYLRRIFVDPMTARSEWGLIRVGGRIAGIYSLSNGLPIKQDGFEAEDGRFQGKAGYNQWLFTYPSDLVLPTDNKPAPASANPANVPTGN